MGYKLDEGVGVGVIREGGCDTGDRREEEVECETELQYKIGNKRRK